MSQNRAPDPLKIGQNWTWNSFQDKSGKHEQNEQELDLKRSQNEYFFATDSELRSGPGARISPRSRGNLKNKENKLKK